MRKILLVAAAAAATGTFLVTVPLFRHFFDLDVYRGAIRWWLLDGGRLYDFRFDGTVYGFTYPPFAALVLSPLALPPRPVAVTLSLLANAAAVVVLLRWWLGARPWWITALIGCAVLLLEPVRDTFSFGQVNLLLVLLVGLDTRAMKRGRRWAGAGIGLAAAIKLTPAVFVLWLLVTRRFRAVAVAAGTAAGATILTAVAAPEASRVFWTSALWDTSRVGRTAYVSNQSLRGVVARLDLDPRWWVLLVVAALVCWYVRVRGTDAVTGCALTGVLACLISPVTWVHHLVWLLPALFLVRRFAVLATLWFVLCSSVVWIWWAGGSGPLAAVGANAYVVVAVILLMLISPGVRAVDKWRSPVAPGVARHGRDS
ncbi:glycosyltransferase 87 family protein [Symbioplanes lichenis]|uniref:glycosyltransferase 87 family protein n=1 Tax=Symbioplanes lichenis TaxID=1629072 RepID=UPI002738EDE1|nr:glycosyltransferase 87 family protein [Actinoplanes lichenis]